MNLPQVKILGVGDCVLDYIFRCPSIAHGGSVRVNEFKTEGGGLTATAIVACARLGAAGELVCRLGSDSIGDEIIDGLSRENVALGHVYRAANAASSISFIHVDIETGDRTIYYYRIDINDDEGVPVSWDMEGVSCLLIDPTWKPGAISAAAQARKLGIPVVADVVPSEKNRDMLSLVDVLIAPNAFGKQHAKDGDYRPALDEIHRLGPGVAVITVGRDGCWFSDGAEVDRMPAFSVDVVDTTGAGDVFHGAFAFGLAMGWDIRRRIEFASAVSALKCRKLGGRAGIPTFDESLEFLSSRGTFDWGSF